ncbi:hypothetical protein [Nesterenkonia sp. HG001]|uniref:hypothetical protein n=1 Tax=Nesterenkonia sp. HG001 TaxID=2983207 RepID=UPI002AC372D7|nr:hypothetical protein [Nesterenkonia sp. HG001]MDZ5077104.1 hypothetical protein [Nesterenkonia sp. HG001]
MEDSTESPDHSSGEPAEPLPPTRRSRREARSRADRRTTAAEPAAREGATAEPAEDSPEEISLNDSGHLESFDVRETANRDPRRPNVLPFVLAGGLVVLITLSLLWWFLVRDEPAELPETVAEREEDPGIDGVILRNADPDQWLAGDCLTGFQPQDETAPATIIECGHSYDVQVIHWEDLEVGEYPGDEDVSERAHMACEDNGQLDQDAVDAVDFELQVRISHPTESTWRREGDRRINCLLQPASGVTMTGNFVMDPEEHSSADDAEDAAPGGGDEDDA